MTTVNFKIEKELPVTHEADVIIFGGGPGGIGAAVMAARAGAKTLLVERYGCLGGMATIGEVHPFMGNHVDDKPLDAPVYIDWVTAMQKYQPLPEPDENLMHRSRFINKDAAMLAAEDIVLDAGAKILYHHTLVDVVMEGDTIKAAILSSKSGFTAVGARVFVDCTGDADLAARAGCEFEMGGPSGHCQPMTTCFKLSHVKRGFAADDNEDRKSWRAELNRIWDEARASGELENPRDNCLCFDWFDEDVVHFNTTRVIHMNATNAAELSRAEIEARKQIRQILAIFRARAPGFADARIHSIAHHIGVRETRRVLGEDYITRKSFETAEKFPDAIARCRYPIDIHNPDGAGTELVSMPAGEWFEIPYGCIVPRDCGNLLVGGRPISVDHAIHASMRVMPPACSVGQAAGMAAAMAAGQSVRPRELDGIQVRRRLVEAGARL